MLEAAQHTHSPSVPPALPRPPHPTSTNTRANRPVGGLCFPACHKNARAVFVDSCWKMQHVVGKLYQGHPAAELVILRGSNAPVRHSISPLGTILSTSDSSSFSLESNSFISVDFFTKREERASFLPRADRLVLSHTAQICYCNLSQSTCRDRIVLRNGMELDFGGVKVLVIAPETVECAWHGKRATSVAPPSLHQQRKRVQFNQQVAFSHLDGTETFADLDEDEGDDDDDKEEQGGVCMLVVNHTEFRLTPQQPRIYLSRTGATSRAPGGQDHVASIVLVGNGLHLLLPRVGLVQEPTVPVLLNIPRGMDFPLQSGDVFQFTATVQVQVVMDNLSRGLPSSVRARNKLNPAYSMQSIALECTQARPRLGRWNKRISHHSSRTTALFWDFAHPDAINIGKRPKAGGVCLPDKTLAFVQCTINQHVLGNTPPVFTCEAVRDYKDVYQLIGKSDAHKRVSPIPLRLGDIFCCGKSVFCVVFQQRGNRKAMPMGSTAGKELAQRSSLLPLSHHRVMGKATASLQQAVFDHGQVKEEPVVVPTFQDLRTLLEFFDISLEDNVPIMALLTLRGPQVNRYFLVDPVETTIGSEGMIAIPEDRRMSPVHCRVYFDESQERWMLEDVESQHGTFCKIGTADPLLLCAGDVLCMGQSTIKVLGSNLTLEQVRAEQVVAEQDSSTNEGDSLGWLSELFTAWYPLSRDD
ncbi:hypothetical protein BASA81_007366 [Batrachochytrium salamandrivorans]|nr:hypothetical protein BASA81_007366 [Batrachochytrium salamandrivorans]